MPKTVHTTLFGDNIDDSKLVTIDNCVCQLYFIKRDDNYFIQRISEDIDQPALYLLLNDETGEAYVGESETFKSRLQQHKAGKEFWNVALCFQANNNSLNVAGVRYLEAVAYDLAKKTGIYRLTNSQVPTKPTLQPTIRYQLDDFFEYVKFLAAFIGCHIFIPGSKKHNPTQKKLSIPATKSEDLKGKLEIKFYGKNYRKANFPCAMIKHYLLENPKTTWEQLQSIFPHKLLGSWGSWPLLQTDLSLAQVTDGHRRYVPGDDNILCSGDGVKFVVCNQWDYVNLVSVLDLARELGYFYEIVK